jgi:hypothetical protein
MEPGNTTCKLGLGAAALAAAFALLYDLGQIAEWLGWLGSSGGPESSSTPLGILILLLPSILLAPSFLVTVICARELAVPERRVLGTCAVALATVYVTMICIVYYLQLTLVGPRLAAGRMEGIELLRFVPFDSFLYAVDILGYSFMCAATLFAGLALPATNRTRTARLWLIANGGVIPFLLLQMQFHSLIWIAAAWAVTFPAAMIALARLFVLCLVRYLALQGTRHYSYSHEQRR